MAARFLLDTNILSDLIRNPQGLAAQRLAEVADATVCTSIVVACELRYGAAKRASPALTQRVEALLDCIPVLPLLRLGDFDLLPPELKDGHTANCLASRAYADVFNEIVRLLRDPVRPLIAVEGGLPPPPPASSPPSLSVAPPPPLLPRPCPPSPSSLASHDYLSTISLGGA